MQPVKTAKGEATRATILETALALFRERGYEGTTMRAIAAEAGVSLGNAYYYFGSKEHLIQAFYARTHEEHLAVCGEVLDREQDLRARLMGVMSRKLDTIEPYHHFAGVLFKTAADPHSPLNPFSEGSRESGYPRGWRGSCRVCCGPITWGSSCSGSTTTRPVASGRVD
jgi:AcrR family transcriptional regulator